MPRLFRPFSLSALSALSSLSHISFFHTLPYQRVDLLHLLRALNLLTVRGSIQLLVSPPSFLEMRPGKINVVIIHMKRDCINETSQSRK